jgi:hypothetical protein
MVLNTKKVVRAALELEFDRAVSFVQSDELRLAEV